MESQPLISVIIPAYNAEDFVAEAVESALAQSYRPIEVIVVNDGSTDNTSKVLESFGDAISVVHQPNGGLSQARNRGIAESQGELFAFLDADDRWLPEKLEKQWECLQHKPEVGLIHTNIYEYRSPANRRTIREVGRNQFQGACLLRLIENHRVLPSTVVVKRECIERVGVFDPVPTATQDWDLWLRIAQYYEFAYVDEPLVEYRIHDANMSANDLKMRSEELFVLRKAIQEIPELSAHLDKQRLRTRLHLLAFDVGYQNFSAANYTEARAYFSQAWQYKFYSWKAAMYWLATWLPAPAIQTMRERKQTAKVSTRSSESC